MVLVTMEIPQLRADRVVDVPIMQAVQVFDIPFTSQRADPHGHGDHRVSPAARGHVCHSRESHRCSL